MPGYAKCNSQYWVNMSGLQWSCDVFFLHMSTKYPYQQLSDSILLSSLTVMVMMMMMMMMNCFLWNGWPRKALSLISSWDHCQRLSPSPISSMLEAGLDLCKTRIKAYAKWDCENHYTTVPKTCLLYCKNNESTLYEGPNVEQWIFKVQRYCLQRTS